MTITDILSAYGFEPSLGGSYLLQRGEGLGFPWAVRVYTFGHEGGEDLSTLSAFAPTLQQALAEAQLFCDLLGIPGVARGADRQSVKAVRPNSKH
jgi:hypothetical protein